MSVWVVNCNTTKWKILNFLRKIIQLFFLVNLYEGGILAYSFGNVNAFTTTRFLNMYCTFKFLLYIKQKKRLALQGVMLFWGGGITILLGPKYILEETWTPLVLHNKYSLWKLVWEPRQLNNKSKNTLGKGLRFSFVNNSVKNLIYILIVNIYKS